MFFGANYHGGSHIIQHRYAQQLKQLKLRLEQVQLLQAAGQNLEQRKAEITVKLQSILCVETESDIFCKSVLEQLTVWNDRHMELRFTAFDAGVLLYGIRAYMLNKLLFCATVSLHKPSLDACRVPF